MLIITYTGRPAAVVARGRAHLLPSIALLEPEHPRRRWVTCMAFFARDVAAGRLPGPYTARRAEHFARCALLPDEEFVALERFPNPVLSEYFNVPLEQVSEKRVDIDAAAVLRGQDATTTTWAQSLL
jgi:hypothetical protein